MLARKLGALAVAVVLAGVAAPPAGAATSLGGTGHTPDAACEAGTVLAQGAAGDASYVVPAGGGVITSWSFAARATADSARLTMFRQAAGLTYDIVGQSPVQTMTPDQINTFATRLAVKAGDVLGLTTASTGVACARLTGSPGDVVIGCQHCAGETGMQRTLNLSDPQYRLNLAATLEPDADGDGYGDETQDGCREDAKIQVGPCQADLSLSQTASAATVTQGKSVSFTLVVTNNGTSPAHGVSVTDTVPKRLAVTSATASAGTCTGQPTVTCAVGDLAPGASSTLTLVAKAVKPGAVSNVATAKAGTADPNAANNSATAATSVQKAFGGVAIRRQTIKVAGRGVAAIKLTCPREARTSCKGKLTLATAGKVPVGARKRVLVLGTVRITLKRGRSAKVSVRLSTAARAFVAGRPSVKAVVRVDARDASGTRKRTTGKATLRRA